MKEIVLRGITWNHSRALPPLVAAAQRFEELHSGVRIQWAKRSLHEFGHAALEPLAAEFDLLVIDHPAAGDVEASGALVDLLPLLSREELEDLRMDSMGPSFSSYLYRGRLWALPIDGAAPAASFRPDLLERNGVAQPALWSDVLALARAGLVRMPGFGADLFLNFLGLCVSCGGAVAESSENLVDSTAGAAALDLLSELAALMPEEIYAMNPILLCERMSGGDDIAYCPFAYTYSNYARPGFATYALRFADPVALQPDIPLRTVLGGTGIALSARCREAAVALEYARYVAGERCQRTLYGLCGGQPARRSAWSDSLLNQISGDFFSRTACSMERAWVRPRYQGYVALQEQAGEVVATHCRQRGNTRRTLERLNALYRISAAKGTEHD